MALITGLSREREQQLQERLFVRVSQTLELSLSREIRQAMQAMAEAHGSPGAQAAVIHNHGKNIETIVKGGWRTCFRLFGNRILDAAQKSHAHIERKALFGGFDAAVTGWIETYGAVKVTEIAGTTHKQAMAVINAATQQAVIDGLDQAATGAMIRRQMATRSAALSVARSRVIARTETHNASQAATQLAAQETGLPMKKEWIASRSDTERARDDHLDADRQIVPLNALFLVGGEELEYPGDPTGSAENVINCRCAVGYHVG